jgi:hypothetical protein
MADASNPFEDPRAEPLASMPDHIATARWFAEMSAIAWSLSLCMGAIGGAVFARQALSAFAPFGAENLAAGAAAVAFANGGGPNAAVSAVCIATAILMVVRPATQPSRPNALLVAAICVVACILATGAALCGASGLLHLFGISTDTVTWLDRGDVTRFALATVVRAGLLASGWLVATRWAAKHRLRTRTIVVGCLVGSTTISVAAALVCAIVAAFTT